MTISRGQMNRQLRMGGGIMDVVPREPAILGGIKKAVKKATKTVKKIAKSPIGKAAIAYGLTAGLGSLGAGKGLGSLTKLSTYAPSTVASNLGAALFGTPALAGDVTSVGGTKGLLGKLNLTQGFGIKELAPGFLKSGVAKGAGLLGLTTFLTSKFGMPEEQVESVLSDPSEKEKYLRLYYTNLNKNASEEEVEEFVRANLAEGTRDPSTPEQGLMSLTDEQIEIPMEDEQRSPSILNKFDEEDLVIIIEMGPDGKPILKPVRKSEVMKDMRMPEEGIIQLDTNEVLRGIVPRDNKALGDSASTNAMQAAGVEGLPIRQNPKGVKELDLRETGGFIPPVGIKEKEDDIPAMLSNNEFVFTADAVRGMGDGNVNVGAQRMYDMMKMLEAGGKV
jgi:hypothetical protein